MHMYENSKSFLAPFSSVGSFETMALDSIPFLQARIAIWPLIHVIRLEKLNELKALGI